MIGVQALLTVYSKLSNKGKVLEQQKARNGPGPYKFAVNSK